MPLVCMIAQAGTLYRRAILSTVSPLRTLTGVPPSQVQCPAGLGGSTGTIGAAATGRSATEPVTSDGGR